MRGVLQGDLHPLQADQVTPKIVTEAVEMTKHVRDWPLQRIEEALRAGRTTASAARVEKLITR